MAAGEREDNIPRGSLPHKGRYAHVTNFRYVIGYLEHVFFPGHEMRICLLY